MTGAVGVMSGYACRLDLPTEAAIVAALRTATTAAADDPGAYPAQLAVGVTADRITRVSAPPAGCIGPCCPRQAAVGHT